MRILITGAASPLGREVAALLIRQGHRVVGLARRVSGVRALERIGVVAVRGDVRQREHVARAILDCEMVLHLAGFFDFWEPEHGTYDSVNVAATREIVAAALAARVRRLVFCSSAITIGESAGTRGDEYSTHRGDTRSALERSKLEAERIAFRARERGLEVVVVNPSLVVAPDDQGWLGRLLRRTVSGRRPLAGHAPLGWVWVDDAAQGVVKAAHAGEDGARYILSGDTLSSHQMLSAIARSVGAPAARTLPPRLTMAEAALHSALARPLRKRPRLALDEARFLLEGFQVDGARARRELGVVYTPSARFIPVVARHYATAIRRVAAPHA